MFFVMFKDANNEYTAVNNMWDDLDGAAAKCETIDKERLPVVVAAMVGKLPISGEMHLAPMAQEMIDMGKDNELMRKALGIKQDMNVTLPSAPGVN